MACTARIATRILVLSDTHSALPDPTNKPELKFSHRLPEADVAIHCGDLTLCGKIDEHKRALALLKSLPAPIKIVIPGNHDMTLDSVYLFQNPYLHGWNRPHDEKDAQDAIAMYTSQDARDAGIIYIVEGLHSVVLPNGAKLTFYASAFTPEFCNWGFAYPRSQDRFNVVEGCRPDNPIPSISLDETIDNSLSSQVAVVVTHGPPQGILDRTVHGESVGCDHLLTAVSRCRPLLHCFGHIHEAWGAEILSWPSDTKNRGAINLKAVDCSMQVSHPQEILEVASSEAAQSTQNVSVIDARAIVHGKQTVFVNASVMNIHYAPTQWPWLIQLELPKAPENEMERS